MNLIESLTYNKANQNYINNSTNKEINLFNSNVSLVSHIITKHFCYKDTTDLYSAGYLGLWSAVKTYDPHKSIFSTYANKCIYNEIIRYLRKEHEHNSNISLDTLETSDSTKSKTVPLNEIILTDLNHNTENEAVDNIFFSEILKIIKKYLTDLEQTVIIKYFGLEGNNPLTCTEIAKILGKSISYIGQIRRRGIIKLKYHTYKNHLYEI